MTNELREEELLKHLAHMFKCYEYNFINVDFKPPEKGTQAYEQIKALIQKLGVTEEWIEEKAIVLTTKMPLWVSYKARENWAIDFIRKLVEEIHGRK